jgi:hypothetical protein
MPRQLVPAVVLAHGSIATTPSWTTLIEEYEPQYGSGWSLLRVRNNTDVRIEGSFDGSTVHFVLDPDEQDEWQLHTQVNGNISVRKTSASTDGDVIAEGVN